MAKTCAERCLSLRAMEGRATVNFMGKYGNTCLEDLYSSEDNPKVCSKVLYSMQDNPKGIINMGAAETYIVEDLWLKKFNEPAMNTYQPSMQYYFDSGGQLKKSLAEFYSRRFHAKDASAGNIVVTSGCAAAMDYLAFCLADPGEYFLLFTPCYSVLMVDVGFRGKVGIIPVPLPTKDRDGTMAYEQNAEDLAVAYAKASVEGKTVRGVIVVSPHNPTGQIVRLEKILEILDFCAEHKLHVIMNEIYALSVFDDGARFESVLILDSVPDPHRLHHVWGFSKDFGLSGMRCGVVYSKNDLITQHRERLNHILYLGTGSVPPVVQDKLRVVIEDEDWLDNVYFPANKRRMQKALGTVCDNLREFGVEYYKGTASMFVWANFQKYLATTTEDCEMELFEKFFQAGVYVLPGSQLLASEPGWFRITFTNQKNSLEEGFRRIATVIKATHP